MTDLVDAFVEAAAAEARSLDRELVGRALTEALATARSRWPGVAIDDRDVASELGRRWTAGGPPVPPFAAELVLARACLRGDAAAVRVFHREMFDRVERVLGKLGLSAADADDIKQDVRAKLLTSDGGEPKLALYHGTGPLAQWVASVAGREALMLLRKRKPLLGKEESLGDDELMDAADDPALNALKTRHSAEFKGAFQAAVAELEPRDRAILRALIVDNRTINEIAAVYGIHRVTASRRVSELRHALLQGTRKRLRERLALDEPSLDSAIRLIDSNLDLSLFRLLADAA
ncbi:MAG TPA: sigma-70 family RNA polymerase sigma factor [Kofleriaceae bacterium]|nr:sigma-70 family RNA polymerase sigma factor [Kofleriaceae bacterium]